MRLFIGLPLPPEAAADTARLAQQARQSIPGRYTLESNYHLTLAFLGEVHEDRLEQVRLVLSSAAAHFPAPRVALGGISYFKQPHSAILIRRADSPDDLGAVREALLAKLASFGLPYADGPFSPHVTLARHTDMRLATEDALRAQAVSFTAPEAVLYLSARDEHDILRYTPLAHAPFAG